MQQTYLIPTERLEDLQSRLSKIARKARKLNCSEPTMVLGDKQMVEVIVGDVVIYGDWAKQAVECIEVTVTGESPKVDGWEFVATIQHLTEGNIIRAVGDRPIPNHYKTCGKACDHCQKIRTRNDTYLVYNEVEDRWAQVGKTCLKDFTGGNSPHQAAGLVSSLLSLFDSFAEAGDRDGYFGSGPTHFSTDGLVVFTALAIRKHGWVSRTQSREEGRLATADTALEMLFQRGPYQHDPAKPLQEDIDLATAALGWIRAKKAGEVQNNNYMWNLRVACSEPFISPREAGLAASVIAAYQKTLEDQARAEAQDEKPSEWVGEPGQRLDLSDLQLVHQFEFSNDYARSKWDPQTVYKHIFKRRDGCIFVWQTTVNGFQVGDTDADDNWVAFEIGKIYCGRGTVKAHTTYQKTGQKQTVLTRCQLSISV